MFDFHHFFIATTEAIQQGATAVGEVAKEATEVSPEAKTSLLGTLGINWKLFISQLVNFGIVLFVFWKWVVKPLGDTLSKRQQKIEEGLKTAELTQKEKESFSLWKQEEMKKTRAEADRVMRQAGDSANKIKQETIVETQQQTDKMLNQTRAMIELEKKQLLVDVKKEVAELVVAASEKILNSKLDARKDHGLISQSIQSVNADEKRAGK